MASAPNNPSDLNQPIRHKQPLFVRVQDWIFKLDVGFGVHWVRLGMFLLLVGTVILVYTGTQFSGLRDREAMDMGQLGRNLAAHRGYVTRNVRPLDLGFLTEVGKPPFRKLSEEGPMTPVPELWTPPVYPLILASCFRIVRPHISLAGVQESLHLAPDRLPELGDWQRLQALFDGARSKTLFMDRIVISVAWLCFVLSLGVVYLLARELFDHRVAMMSVVLYLLCDPMLDACINGAPTAWLALLFMTTAYALVKAEQWVEAKRPVYWAAGALGVCGLVVGLGTLTVYAFGCVLVPLMVYVGVSMRSLKRSLKFGILLGVFGLVLLPWVARNLKVAHTPFGLAWLTIKEPPAIGVEEEQLQLQMQRRLEGALPVRWLPLAVRVLVNLDKLYREPLKETGASYLMAFFLASLLHRFKRDDVFRLRRYLFWSLLMGLVFLAVAGVPKRNFFTLFVPLVLIYGSAFFFVMFERLQFRTRWVRRGMVGLFATLNVLPFILTLLPPGAPTPYPPYDGGAVAAMAATFRGDDVLASDMPWAVAWYGDRTAVLMPATEADYLKINDELHLFAGVYMTQLTLNEVKTLEILSGAQQFWLSKYRKPLPTAPLPFSRPLTPDGQQVLTSNRQR